MDDLKIILIFKGIYFSILRTCTYNVPVCDVVLYLIQIPILHTIMESVLENLVEDARSSLLVILVTILLLRRTNVTLKIHKNRAGKSHLFVHCYSACSSACIHIELSILYTLKYFFEI